MSSTRQVSPRTELATPIWNPEAAVNWSLPFTPIFGSFLQMKNWRTLGQPEKAHEAMIWLIISFVMFGAYVGIAVLAHEEHMGELVSRIAAFAYLGVWYLAFARKQMAFVKANYGDKYPKKKWWVPLGIAIGCVLATYAAAFAVGVVLGVANAA